MATIVKSIGTAAGRDYATVQAFIDSIPTDVVASGNAYVGELYNDSEFTDANGKVSLTGKTTSASCNITLRAAAGQSFATNPNRSSNALWYNRANGVGIKTAGTYLTTWNINANYTVVEGLQIWASGLGGMAFSFGGTGAVIKNCILIGTPDNNVNSSAGAMGGNGTIMDSLIVSNAAGVGNAVQMTNGTLINCTIVKPSTFVNGTDAARAILFNYGTNVVKNCAMFGFTGRDILPNSFSASDYNATDWNQAPGGSSGTHNQLNLTYANQFISTVNDFRLRAGSDLLDKGTNLSATYQISDIYGLPRQSAWDIGAYELPVPATGLTLTGPVLGSNQQPSTNFTVGANGSVANAITVTPSDNGAGGTFTPQTLQIVGDVPNATFTYTPANVGDVTISLTSDGALTLPASLVYRSAVPATKVNVVAPTTAARAGQQSGNFVVSLDGIVTAPVKVIPSDGGAGGSFNPPFISLDNTTLQGTFTYVGASVGVKTITTSNDGGLANTSVQITEKPPIVLTPTPSTNGLIVKSIGTGKDYATLKDFAAYARGVDLSANRTSILGEVYENQAVSGVTDLYATNATTDYRVIVQPVPGNSINDLDKGEAVDYGTEGIELVISAGMRLSYGAVMQGFRVNINGNGSLAISGMGNGPTGQVSRNRIKVNPSTNIPGIATGEYGAPCLLTDNLFFLDGGTGDAVSGNGTLNILRNTFVRRNGATGHAVFVGNGLSLASKGVVGNNVFLGFGDTPVVNTNLMTAANLFNNFTDAALATAAAGITVVTTGNMVRNALNDFRPDDNGPLIGAASSGAIDTTDLYNGSRGGVPDAGAIQGSVVKVLSKVSITSQDVNAQSITVNGTCTNGPISGAATLLPDSTNPNGALQQGPTPITLTNNGSSWTVKWDKVPAGNYQTPVIRITNDGGTNLTQTGGAPINILPISASIIAAEAASTVGNAPTLAIAKTGFDLNTISLDGVVDTQGDANAVINAFIDFTDGRASVGPVKANIFGKKWAVQLSNVTGGFKVRLEATANSKPTVKINSNNLKVIKIQGGLVLPVPD
jgi:hypothetical protein